MICQLRKGVNMRRIFANLSYSFVANLLNMLVSILVVLLIPRFWGEVAYGYYQLYLFYISYVGFFHLGWLDGIYLRVAGKDYSKLDRSLYATQFWLLCGITIIVSIFLGIIGRSILVDENKVFIVLTTCICLILFLLRTYLIYIFQSTDRIKPYAKVIISEKIVFIIGLAAIFISSNKTYELLIYADLLGKVVSLLLAIIYGKEIIFCKFQNIKNVLKEIGVNITVGCKLMMANIASMLIIGIVRLAIENNWDIATFGKVSLSLSVSNLLISFIMAVSVVMFPLLKNVSDEKKTKIYQLIGSVLMPALFFVLLFYHPAQRILGTLLPVYKDSLRYLAIMFPVCVFECKMSVLNNTYLKVFRKEKQILYINLITVICSFIVTIITVYMFKSLELAIGSIVFLVAIRNYIAEICLAKIMKISLTKNICCEITLTIIFILTSWFINSWTGMFMYAICFVIYMFYIKNNIKESIRIFKNGNLV